MGSIDPRVRFALDRMRARGLSLRALEKKAGVSRNAVFQWERGRQPGLGNLSSVLEVLGYELVVVKKGGLRGTNGGSRAVARRAVDVDWRAVGLRGAGEVSGPAGEEPLGGTPEDGPGEDAL